MFVAKRVRAHIESLDEKQIITTRELLHCGRRNSIDLELFKLVKNSFLLRLARGVFIKRTESQYIPSVLQIAQAKAKAFRKKITEHGNNAALKFEFPFSKENQKFFFEYFTSGPTSSFRCIHGTVKFQSVGLRVMSLRSSKANSLLKAVWYLGNRNRITTRVKLRYWEGQLKRTERLEFRESIKIVPEWIYNTFYPTGWYSRSDLKTSFSTPSFFY